MISIDSDELTDSYKYLRIKLDEVADRDLAVVALLSGGRFADSETPTVLT